MGNRLGIDLGGTKTEVLVLDPAGRSVYRQRVATPAQSYDAILDLIVELVQQAEAKLELRTTVGIGIPGAISPGSGLLRNSNTVCMNGRPFRDDLEGRLGREVRIENDANCFALSEALDGAAQGYPVVFGVIIGTGTGGGLVVDGKLLNGPQAISGEWGHNPLPWPEPTELPGPACWCGLEGCIETWLSGPALARTHSERTGQTLAAHDIAGRAAGGDVVATESMSMFEAKLARALAHVINLFDPDIVVLGGGLSNIKRLYENLPSQWERWVFSDQVATRIVPPMHGDSSGVRGAARLWPAEGPA